MTMERGGQAPYPGYDTVRPSPDPVTLKCTGGRSLTQVPGIRTPGPGPGPTSTGGERFQPTNGRVKRNLQEHKAHDSVVFAAQKEF